MKKALRFTALVGILATTIVLSTGPKAQAVTNCETLAGKGCSPAGSSVDCQMSWGDPGGCVCSSSYRWICYF